MNEFSNDPANLNEWNDLFVLVEDPAIRDHHAPTPA